MKRRTIVAAVLSGLLLAMPIGAAANDCQSVRGAAFYSFASAPGVGAANLHYDGEQMFVPIEGVEFDPSNFPIIRRVTEWDFPFGSVMMEETYELTFVGNAIKFHATVIATGAAEGQLDWDVNSNPTVLFNTFRQIEGSLCVNA